MMSAAPAIRYFRHFPKSQVDWAIGTGKWARTGRNNGLSHHEYWSECLEWIGEGEPVDTKFYAGTPNER